VAFGFGRSQRGVQLVITGPESRRGPRPFDAQLARGFDRLLFALAYHGDEVAAPHDADQSGKLRALVHGHDLCLRLGRTDHARVQHAGHLQVAHVAIGAFDLRRNVQARHRFSDDGVLRRILRRGLLGDLHVEHPSADQLA
jgi:hypothetical protein